MIPKHSTRLAVALVALGWSPRAAFAEAGEHIRTGSAVVVPSAEFVGAWRSNVYLSEADEQAGTYLALRPALSVDLDTTDARVRLDGEYALRKYLTPGLSNLDRYNDFRFDGLLDFLRQSVIGVRSRIDYAITSREVDAEYAEDAYLERQDLRLDAAAVLRPGPSLDIAPGGLLRWQDYNTSEGLSNTGSPDINSRLEYGPAVDLKWRFFPRTAVVAGYRTSWFYWENNFLDVRSAADWITSTPSVGCCLGIPDGRDTRTYFGLRGRFTSRLVLGATIGTAQLTYDEQSVIDDAANDPIGQDELADGFDADLQAFPSGITGVVEMDYQASEAHELVAGYRRDFRDVYFTNYVAFHGIFGEYHGRYGDRVRLDLTWTYRYEDFVGEYQRQDHFIRTQAELGYRAARGVELRLGGHWTERGSADGQHPEVEFDDFGLSAGVGFEY